MKIVIAIFLNKMKFFMGKPIYIGFALLELNEVHMYETIYEKLQPYLEGKIYNYIQWILIA